MVKQIMKNEDVAAKMRDLNTDYLSTEGDQNSKPLQPISEEKDKDDVHNEVNSIIEQKKKNANQEITQDDMLLVKV